MRNAKKAFICLLAALTLFSLASCSSGVETGPKLDSNIARVYSAETGRSRFVLNGALLDGEAEGVAQIDISADGKACLAWVRSSVYYVSEAGTVPFGIGVTDAEISFDGSTAFFLQDGALKVYSAADDSVRTVEEGLDSLVQLAVSPSSKCAAFTASYPGDGFGYSSKLYKDGSLTPVLEDKTAIVIAVSDDADIIYYFDTDSGAFTVRKGGEDRVISTECDSLSSYNFTRDLSEVVYITGDKINRLFRLSDGFDTELGKGFGFPLKTDVYSRSIITLYAYINDVDSFTNGLWLLRTKTDSGYLYDIVRIDKDGGASEIVGDAESYKVSHDGQHVLWSADGALYLNGVGNKASKIAGIAADYEFSSDGSHFWYLDELGDLYCAKTGKKPRLTDSGVREMAVIGKYCIYISRNGDGLYRSSGIGYEKLWDNAAYIDTRCGQLLIYSDKHETDLGTEYTLTVTPDGEDFDTRFEGVMP